MFHSYEKANPPCSKCGCVKVAWVPGGGHIAKTAPSADATLRSLADQAGMTNMNSPSHSRVNRAMPKVEQPPVDLTYGVRHFAPGFSAAVSSQGATCGPSVASVDLRGSVRINRQLPRATSVPGPAANSVIAGRHVPAER